MRTADRVKLYRGLLQIYTGRGKGKTTAAVGLALRAAGAGLKVCMIQFAKGVESGEMKMLKKFPRTVSVRQFGARSFIRGGAKAIDCALAEKALATAARVMAGGRFDVVVLDELCIACHFRMIRPRDVLDMLEKRPLHVEVVITGRNAPKELVDAADLVTEMKDVKHYFSSGIRARKGIEY